MTPEWPPRSRHGALGDLCLPLIPRGECCLFLNLTKGTTQNVRSASACPRSLQTHSLLSEAPPRACPAASVTGGLGRVPSSPKISLPASPSILSLGGGFVSKLPLKPRDPSRGRALAPLGGARHCPCPLRLTAAPLCNPPPGRLVQHVTLVHLATPQPESSRWGPQTSSISTPWELREAVHPRLTVWEKPSLSFLWSHTPSTSDHRCVGVCPQRPSVRPQLGGGGGSYSSILPLARDCTDPTS